MDTSITHIVWKWINLLDIRIAKSYIKNLLEQHPNYPSVLSITDALQELGFENIALEIERPQLEEIPLPFLAHVTVGNKPAFEIIAAQSQLSDESGFFKRWNNIIIACEKPEGFKNIENDKAISKERRHKLINILVLTSIVLVSCYAMLTTNNFVYSLMMATNLLALVISATIATQDLGVKSSILDRVCPTTKNVDCNKVMKSLSGKLKVFTLSDVCIIYFLSQWLILTSSGIAGFEYKFLVVFKLLSIMSIPFIIFSIIYQWKFIKNWCLLCLNIAGILTIQFLILNIWVATEISQLSARLTALFLIPLGGIIIGWSYFKNLIKENQKIKTQLNEALRFRNNPSVFQSVLNQQRRIETRRLGSDLEIGNPDASFQIIMASNPFCPPCAEAHLALEELTTKYGDSISIVVRFVIDSNLPQNKGTIAAKHIFQLLKLRSTWAGAYTQHVLKAWYSSMDLDKFKKEHHIENYEDVEDDLSEHSNWTERVKIDHTPTIFINGYELPNMYRIDRLSPYIHRMISDIKAFA